MVVVTGDGLLALLLAEDGATVRQVPEWSRADFEDAFAEVPCGGEPPGGKLPTSLQIDSFSRSSVEPA